MCIILLHIGEVTQRVLALILIAAVLFSAGCATQRKDPLDGWHLDVWYNPTTTVKNDYQNYLQKLSPQEFVNFRGQYADGKGDHVIWIETGRHDTL
jgi:hypothetical protein